MEKHTQNRLPAMPYGETHKTGANGALPAPYQAILNGWHIGVDEAGRGCLAGPVCAGAVLVPPKYGMAEAFAGLTDSKALSEKKRGILASSIRQSGLIFGIGFSWASEIDRVNILNATFRAMSRALLALLYRLRFSLHGQNSGCLEFAARQLPVFIDGPHAVPAPQFAISLAGRSLESRFNQDGIPASCSDVFCRPLQGQYPVIGGDALIPAVSAASILAKTSRDDFMRKADARWPGYGLAGHKGYGTRQHLEALRKLGPCPLHRKSFGPCADQIRQATLF